MASIPVLVVDDEPDEADLIAKSLESVDERLVTTPVTDPEEALARFETEGYACVVSDYRMNGRSGLELLAAVRERDPDAPFILLTGAGNEGVASEAISAGVSDYLTKEAGTERFEVLANRIENAVARREAERTAARRAEAMDAASDGMAIHAPDGTFTYVNDAFAGLFGLEPADFVGEDWRDWFDEDETERLETEALPAMGETGSWRGEVTGRGAEGDPVRIDLSLSAMADDRFVCVARDRRDQRALEASLRDQKDKIETLHEVAQEIETCETEQEIFDLAIDAFESVLEFDMCIIDVVDGEKLIPVAVSTEMPASGYESSTIEEGVAGQVVRTGEPSLIDDVQTHPEAEPESDAYHSAISVPIGQVALFQAVAEERSYFDEDDLELAELLSSHVREAIQRLRSEADLRAERDRFAALFENVPDAVARCRVDADGEAIVLDVNVAFEEVFGYEAADLVGEPLDDFVMPSGRRDEGERFNRLALERGVETTEVLRRTADGERDFLVRPIPIEPGVESGELYVVYTDISDQKTRERQLARQNERLDEFASVVSHDLRNPLNVAQGRLDLARERGEREDFEEIDTALNRMGELIEGLLELAREGQVTAEPERVDLAGVARSAWLPDSPDATLEVESGLGTVIADPTRLPDLFANLFRNAVDHGGPAVTVRVGATEEGFFVEDDGPGIDQDLVDEIFEAGHTTATEGMGFGLAIVERIAEAHDWSITVAESDAGGARFEITGVEFAD